MTQEKNDGLKVGLIEIENLISIRKQEFDLRKRIDNTLICGSAAYEMYYAEIEGLKEAAKILTDILKNGE